MKIRIRMTMPMQIQLQQKHRYRKGGSRERVWEKEYHSMPNVVVDEETSLQTVSPHGPQGRACPRLNEEIYTSQQN